jgi:hypothetical protein
VLLLTACGSSFQAVKPAIDASLLQACVDPLLAPDEPSDNELAAERYGWPISTARPGMARRPLG